MNITPLSKIKDPRAIEMSARDAADHDRGPQANPYVEGSPEHLHWLNVYYARVHDNAVAIAA